MADLFIGIMIAHGCDPDVAKNLVYSFHDWHSKKATYSAPNDYDTAMSQMAEASSEMLEELPSIFPNFRGYFLVGEAHHFFRKYMGKSKHPVLNTEKVVHPTTITCQWWDTDQQLVAVCHACIALSAATGLVFHHSNIKNFDDVMPVLAAMKRRSEERLDAAILREEEEEDAAKRSEERLLDAAICREDKEMKEERRSEERVDAAIRREEEEEDVAKRSEKRLDAAIRREEEEEDAATISEERLLDAAIRREEKEMKEVAAARRKKIMEAAAVAEVARRKEMQVAAAVAARRKEMQEVVEPAAEPVVAVEARRKEMQEAWRRKEIMEDETVAAEAVAERCAAAGVKRKAFLEFSGSQPSCIRLCNHVGCSRSVVSTGACRGHGPRCSHGGCSNDFVAGGVCRGHGLRCSHVGCTNDVIAKGVCYWHGPRCSHVGCFKNVFARGVCKGHD